MTLVEYFAANQEQLRKYLMGEQARLQAAIRQASVEGRRSDVDDLRSELDEVNDGLGLLEAVRLNQIIAAKLALPDLPADFREALQEGQVDLAKWQQLQGVIQRTIQVAGAVADGVGTIAKLVVRYGRYLA
jgi:predicted nuclease with TOPRIM domain